MLYTENFGPSPKFQVLAATTPRGGSGYRKGRQCCVAQSTNRPWGRRNGGWRRFRCDGKQHRIPPPGRTSTVKTGLVGWDCRIQRLHFCRGVKPFPTSVLIRHYTIWWWGSSSTSIVIKRPNTPCSTTTTNKPPSNSNKSLTSSNYHHLLNLYPTKTQTK